MRKLIVLFLLIINGFLGFSQELDSLIKDLDNLSGEKKVKQLNKITWKLRNSDPRTAIIYNGRAIILADKESFNYELTKAYNFAGVLYRNLGVYAQALESYQIAVDLALKYGVDDQLGYAYNNFGNLYLYQESPLLAKQYLFLVLPIAEKLKNDDLLAYAYQNLGRSYLLLGKNDSARILLDKALDIRIKANIIDKIGVTYKYLADVSLVKNDYKEALEYYNLANKNADFETDIDLFADYCSQLSKLYSETDRQDSALFYASLSLGVARKVRSNLRIMRACEQLGEVYWVVKDFAKAYQYAKMVNLYKDSLYNEQVTKRIASIEFTKEELKKQAEIELLQKDLEIKDSDNKRIILLSIFLGLGVIGSIIFIIFFNRNRNKIKQYNKKLIRTNSLIEEKNNELKEQSIEMEVQAQNLQNLNNVLENQYKTLGKKQMLITDSINYARRIQHALMPDELTLQRVFKNYFIVNIPRDIVSGDFFWLVEKKDVTYFAVADSTGHGVSGAFMSVLGISLLNEILNNPKSEKLDSGIIINELRTKVKESLGQKTISDNKDGLDISFVKIDKKNHVLEFVGAHNDSYMLGNSGLEVIESQRMSVSVSRNEKSFQAIKKAYLPGSKLYFSTDGFQDQLGGSKGRKYFRKNYRDFLFSISSRTFNEQHDSIINELKEWQGEKYKQIDDILIVGLEL